MTSNKLCKVEFRGIRTVCDMALWIDNEVALISIYGSETQARGIFSAVVLTEEINLITDDDLYILTRPNIIPGFCRYKSWKFGYGKYHAIIWHERLIDDCIIANSPDNVLESWEQFLAKKRIPLLKPWIPLLIKILTDEGLIEEANSIGFYKCWYWKASDNEVCDLIVKKIYKSNGR